MKIVIRIFNLIYIALAAVACTMLLTRPFIEINADIGIKKDLITKELVNPLEGKLTEDEIKDCLPDTINVPFNLKLPAEIILHSDDKENTKKVIDEQIDVVVNDAMDALKDPIHTLAEKIAKKVASQAIHDSISQQISSVPGSEDAQEAMEKAGIDDKYIDDFTDEVYEVLKTEGATIDTLMSTVNETIEDVCSKLQTAGVAGFVNASEKVDGMSGEIRTQLESVLKENKLCDDKGNLLNIDDAIDSLIGDMLSSLLGGNNSDENNDENPQSDTIIKNGPEEAHRAILRADEPETEKEESSLNETIRKVIVEKVDGLEIPEKVADYGKFALYGLLALTIPWVLLAVLTLIRTIRIKKCWTKVWFFFVLAFEQIILGIGLFLTTKMFLPKLATLIPNENLKGLIESSSLVIKTSTLIPSIIYLAFIPLTIIYLILTHKVKKHYKEAKKAAK